MNLMGLRSNTSYAKFVLLAIVYTLQISGFATSSVAAANTTTTTTSTTTVITTVPISISGRTYNLKPYFTYVKSVRHNLKISYRWHVCNC
jgi:hypothetical protein